MKIKGIPVSTTMPRSDWNQDDPRKADYIKNKPTSDTTLSVAGKAADAKATGDAVAALSATVTEIADSRMIINSASGTRIEVEDSADFPITGLTIYGKTVQNGTPTPDEPIKLVIPGDNGSISVTVTDGTENNVQVLQVSTPNGLPGIPVSSGGNYTDASGQQRVCDEKDFAHGVYVKRLVNIQFDGSEDEAWEGMYADNGSLFGYKIKVDGIVSTEASAIPVCLCNRYQAKPADDLVAGMDGISVQTVNGDCYVRVYAADYYNVGGIDWRTDLAELPLVCIFQKAIPEETELSAEELAAYATLHTHKTHTTVSNDAGAWMNLKYVADTNAYLERRFAECVSTKKQTLDDEQKAQARKNIGADDMRDINTGKLTSAEKKTFSSLVGADFLGSEFFVASNNLPGFASWAYANANVDIGGYLRSVHKTFIMMFDWYNKAENGYKRKLLDETDENRNYLAMLVPGSYSGCVEMEAHGYFYTLTVDDYQVGDIFCMRYADYSIGADANSCYYMALCIAENKFLLYQDFGAWEDATNASNTRVIDYAGITDIINNSVTVYYYVLRPENIAIADTVSLEKKVAALENLESQTLMEVTEADNGKFLRVVDGMWAVATVDSAEEASF